MMGVVRTSRLARLLIAGLLAAAWPRPSAAQEMAFAERGPRFLLPAKAGAAPVEIEANSSALLRRVVSLNLEHPTVKRLLDGIGRQTGLKFYYSEDVLAPDRPVALRADSITVATALVGILMDAGVDVLLPGGNRVALVKKSRRAPIDTGAVVGRVTDKKTGVALAGATVAVDGIRRTATTGDDGRYRIADVAPGTYTVRARYIGYAPGAVSVTVSTTREVAADLALEKSAQRLDEVVTTGTVVPTEIKALPTPISVITADQIAQQNVQQVDQLLRGQVPGVFAWNTGPENYRANFATTRGASTISFNNTLKVYVDGIEIANEDYVLNRLDPASIDRMEIVRGPQASTLYGSEALNGVIQIFTKKGQAGLGRPEVEAKVSGGVVESRFADKATVAQDYGLQVRGGNQTASYTLGGSYRRTGAYVPGYGDWNGGAYGGMRLVNGPLTVDFSARYSKRTTNTIINPLYPAAYPQTAYKYEQPEQVYTASATYQVTPQWEHVLVAGVDRMALDLTTLHLSPTPADTLNAVNSGEQNRASLRYHTTFKAPLSDALSTMWTAGLEHWVLNNPGFSISPTPTTTGSLVIPPSAFVSLQRVRYTNDGYFGQFQAGLHDALFLTAGIRAERNDNVGANIGTLWAPRLGFSAVKQLGSVSAKVRASYGKAIRPPAYGTATGSTFPFFIVLPNANLRPEKQVGFDGGIELYFGDRTSVQATYYYQQAQDLLYLQLISFDTVTFASTNQYVNLARVKNTGLELQASVALLRPLTLNATYSLTNSVVDSLTPGYRGYYQPGDRLLGVPRHSGSATLTLTLPHTMLSTGLTYVAGWVAFDYARLYTDYYVNFVFSNPTRSYWMNYPAAARVRLSASQQLTPQVTAFAQVDNLTNQQTGERDNLTIAPGRTTTVGLRVHF